MTAPAEDLAELVNRAGVVALCAAQSFDRAFFVGCTDDHARTEFHLSVALGWCERLADLVPDIRAAAFPKARHSSPPRPNRRPRPSLPRPSVQPLSW